MGMNDDGYTRFHLGTLRSEIACTGNVVFTGNIVGVGPEFTLVRNRSGDFMDGGGCIGGGGTASGETA